LIIISDIDQQEIITLYPTLNYKNEPIDWKKISINKNSLVDKNSYIQEFFCKYCSSLSKKPYCCAKCEYNFCLNCLEENLSNINSCINCNVSPFNEKNLSENSKDKLINIEFYCPENCNAITNLRNLEEHLSQCERRGKCFVCDLCNSKFLTEEQAEKHSTECPDRNYKCPFCFYNCLVRQKEDHKSDCKFVICEKCLCKIPPNYIKYHRESSCFVFQKVIEKIAMIKDKLL